MHHTRHPYADSRQRQHDGVPDRGQRQPANTRVRCHQRCAVRRRGRNILGVRVMRRFLAVTTMLCATVVVGGAGPQNNVATPAVTSFNTRTGAVAFTGADLAAVTPTLCTLYTTPGTYSYVISPNAKWFSLVLVGGGSSGASGISCTSGTACSGGAGGSAGAILEIPPTSVTFTGTQSIVVGAGGAAPTAAGQAGNVGASTTAFGYAVFGAGAPSPGTSGAVSASGGSGGYGGAGGSAGATAGVANSVGGSLVGVAGGAGSGAPTSRDVGSTGGGGGLGGGGAAGGNAMFGPTGGGSGAGFTATPATGTAGRSGTLFTLGSAAGGATAGAAGANGIMAANLPMGTGGGGGANNTAGSGGAGGAGVGGGGGGGGGASIGGGGGLGGAGGSGGASVCTGG